MERDIFVRKVRSWIQNMKKENDIDLNGRKRTEFIENNNEIKGKKKVYIRVRTRCNKLNVRN
jgi:hypothetical protein